MPRYTGAGLPQQPMSEQLRNKVVWNLRHAEVARDFYTIGYAGRNISQVISILRAAGVLTLVDIRYNAVSPRKPEFSKGNLKRELETNGIGYLHRRDLGVPREVRVASAKNGTRDSIWQWYDANVVSWYVNRNLHDFFNSMEHPVAMMCVEHDPTACHRHRLFLALEGKGLLGYDL